MTRHPAGNRTNEAAEERSSVPPRDVGRTPILSSGSSARTAKRNGAGMSGGREVGLAGENGGPVVAATRSGALFPGKGFMVLADCKMGCAPFWKTFKDYIRCKEHFCSVKCCKRDRDSGPLMIEVGCRMGCGQFWKTFTEFKRCNFHYCSSLCYQASVDRQALGRAGASVARFVTPEKRFARSQKGGLARAKSMTKERLSEIGRKGIQTRLARSTQQKLSAEARKGAFTRLGTKKYFGINVAPPRKRT